MATTTKGNTATLPGGRTNVVNAPTPTPTIAADNVAMAVPSYSSDAPKKDTPAKETKEVSARTYKARIKKLNDELAAKDLEIQAAVDKALIFQGEAHKLKETLEAVKIQHNNTLIAIRGSVVNSVNIIDVMGGQ